jgi:hypothetical protein
VPDVLPLVREYYAMPGNGAGGSLHIVLDDLNLDDDSVAWSVKRARERGDGYGERLGIILLAMSRTQRLKLAQHSHKRVWP